MNVTQKRVKGRGQLRRWLLIWAFVSVAALAVFFRHSIIQSFSDWRFNTNLEKSFEFAKEGNLRGAIQLVRAAIQLRPDSVDAGRHFFDLCREANDLQSAVELARRLCLHPGVQPEEKAELLTFLLIAKDFDGYEGVCRQLSLEIRENPEIRWTYVLWLTGRGDFAVAREELEDLIAENAEPRFQFPLATLLLSRPDVSDRAQGLELLLEVMKGDDRKIALDAARSVERMDVAEVDAALSAAVQSCILAHEDATADDNLFAYTLAIRELRDEKGERSKRIEEAIVAVRDVDLGSLSRWLYLLGESKRILEFLDPEMAAADPEQFQIYLAALMYEDRWEEANNWVASPPPALDRPRLEALHAMVNSSQGKSADSHWRVALNQAALDRLGNHYPMIYQMAAAAGATEIAVEALVCWFERGTVNTPSLAQSLPALRYLSMAGREHDVITILTQLSRREPDNPTIINGLAYGKILTDYDIPGAIVALEKLRDRFPEESAYRTSLALGYLKAENPDAAHAELTREPQIVWARTDDAERSVWALVLAKQGRDVEAKKVRKTILPERLSPTEQRLFLNANR